jgi:bacillopeptidase F
MVPASALVLLFSITLLSIPLSTALADKLSPRLTDPHVAVSSERINVVVFFSANQTVAPSSIASSAGRTERYRTGYSQLINLSEQSHQKFQADLATSNLSVTVAKRFWIANAALVSVHASDVEQLANLESVEFVAPDVSLELVAPVETIETSAQASGAESNLLAINADKVWAMGYTGAGRLVFSFDTGVDGSHPGLAARWRGASSGDSSAAWYDPYGSALPIDNSGHGTHVMGLMAGVFEGDTVGVAPDVEWGCAAVVDRGAGFSQTISDILSAFEWAADPDGNPETIGDLPDAICHSWGIPKGVFGACDPTFWQAVDNLEQLGIVNIFACGNEGPSPQTIRTPADRGTTPLNAFSVGAVDHRIEGYPVAGFSSRGPANCDTTQIKPEVVAPGIGIKSLKPGSQTKLMSGTSMAAPQVAGAVALLRQYNPEATVEEIKHALLLSARDIETPGEDNASGHGLIDLEKAIEYMPSPSHALVSFRSAEIADGSNGILQAGESADLVVEIEVSNVAVDGLHATLQSYDSNIVILSDSALFGTLAAGNIATNGDKPFLLSAGRYVAPGTPVHLRLDFYDDSNEFLSNAYFDVVIGQNGSAASASVENGYASVGSCNFGIVGLGTSSIVNRGEAGFSVNGADYLSELALVLSDSEGRVSDAARDTTGKTSDNDFLASEEVELEVNPSDRWGDWEVRGEYTDALAETPLGMQIRQSVSMFGQNDCQFAAFVRFEISVEPSVGSRAICAGILTDVDFGGTSKGIEGVGIESDLGLSYYFDAANSRYIGVGILSHDLYSYTVFSNPFDAKAGISDVAKHASVRSGVIGATPSKTADYFHIMSARPTTIQAGQTYELAATVVYANSVAEIRQRFIAAKGVYMAATDADAPQEAVLPAGFSLAQNYPNPFNPTTTISFATERAGNVRLSVLNVLGQKVATLVDSHFLPGSHSVVWNGADDQGKIVASGVYFYRLETASGSVTRKMALLK